MECESQKRIAEKDECAQRKREHKMGTNYTYFLAVALKIDERFGHRLGEAFLGNTEHLRTARACVTSGPAAVWVI